MTSQDNQTNEAAAHNPMTSVRHDAKRSSGQLFTSITDAKRNSGDLRSAEKRQSLSEQSAPKGIVGTMWENFTKGTASK